MIATTPGGKLYHHGQFDGARVKVPVFLDRGPVEAPDAALHDVLARACVGLSGALDWRLLD